ncbi:hypothetical protein TSACC_22066 [Terrimicrobium sacchariphilum]|uniref:Lipoprotein n=1 Tax=Terrimicrobium sacchariphilum TaxID=690879 RepID=A0A146G7F8_TERSA|nr:hypothetical protein [Terrimicrobium sacchariphilum]GAT33649.1 hypothetical protein TSACC_22066 [Terrimicrobium sacchariphilum]
MKFITPLAAITAALTSIACAQVTQIEIAARYEGIDPGIVEGASKDEPANLAMPRITVKSGKIATVHVNGEYIFPIGDESHEASAGASIKITAAYKDGKCTISGMSLLRKPDVLESKESLSPKSFVSFETFFSGTVSANTEIPIELGQAVPGTLFLKLTPLDANGKPAS